MTASEGPYAGCKLMLQGAEAKLFRLNFHGNEALVKERFSKKYRHPQLDKNLTQQRVNAEVRALTRCRCELIVLTFSLKQKFSKFMSVREADHKVQDEIYLAP